MDFRTRIDSLTTKTDIFAALMSFSQVRQEKLSDFVIEAMIVERFGKQHRLKVGSVDRGSLPDSVRADYDLYRRFRSGTYDPSNDSSLHGAARTRAISDFATFNTMMKQLRTILDAQSLKESSRALAKAMLEQAHKAGGPKVTEELIQKALTDKPRISEPDIEAFLKKCELRSAELGSSTFESRIGAPAHLCCPQNGT